jgi:ribonuclease HI
VKEPAQSAIAIGALYSNYTAANSARPKLRKAGWAKPLNDFVKLNVDASFDADDLRGATGAIIRDSNGLFIAASTSKVESVHDVLSAVIHALKEGLILAQIIGCNKIVCCSDNVDVIQGMKEEGYSNCVAAAILDDCYHLATEFVKIEFEHNFCEANMVAHELAKSVHRVDQQPPYFIIPFLVNDVTLVLNE